MEDNHNELLEFVDSLAALLHEATRPLYRKRSEYPIDDIALYENSLLATALYDRYYGIKPSKEQAEAVAVEEGSYQRLLKLYEDSSDDPAKAITEYCDAMNGVIDERAFSKGGTHFILTPNLFSYSSRIEEILLSYKRKRRHGETKSREKRKSLALDA